MSTLKKSTLILVATLYFPFKSYCQLSIGMTTGIDNLIGFQGGYNFTNKLEAGIKFSPALQILSSQGTAGYFGPFVKYFISGDALNSDKKLPIYLRLSVGSINPPKNSYYEEILSNGNIRRVDLNYKSIIGGALGAGIQLGQGSLKYLGEIGVGKVPSFFKSLSSTDPYSDDITNTSKAFTSPFYINFGIAYTFKL